MKELINISIASKSFGEQQILQEVDLSVREGEFVSILGKSGCGKTTLLRLIVGLDTDFVGEIVAKKEDLNTGMVFQEPRLIPWLNVVRNVGFALSPNMKEEHRDILSGETLDLVGLYDFDKSWIHELSGGMIQRVALARALVSSPQLLLMDEPFGALDSFTRMEMQQEVHKIVKEQKVASLMVTHDIEEAIVLSDRILILGGTPATVQHSYEISLTNRFDRTSKEFLELRSKILRAIL